MLIFSYSIDHGLIFFSFRFSLCNTFQALSLNCIQHKINYSLARVIVIDNLTLSQVITFHILYMLNSYLRIIIIVVYFYTNYSQILLLMCFQKLSMLDSYLRNIIYFSLVFMHFHILFMLNSYLRNIIIVIYSNISNSQIVNIFLLILDTDAHTDSLVFVCIR